MFNIALSGKIASGKSTLAQMISAKYGHKIVSIATPIKLISTAIAEANEDKLLETLDVYSLKGGIAEEIYLKMMQKEEYMPIIYDDKGEIVKNSAYRKLLQDVGQVGRVCGGYDAFWVECMIRGIEKEEQETNTKIFVVVDDLRMGKEYLKLQQWGYRLFRLYVDKDIQKERILSLYGEDFDFARLQDATETELDHVCFEYSIDANQTLNDMFEEFMSQYEMIGNI